MSHGKLPADTVRLRRPDCHVARSWQSGRQSRQPCCSKPCGWLVSTVTLVEADAHIGDKLWAIILARSVNTVTNTISSSYFLKTNSKWPDVRESIQRILASKSKKMFYRYYLRNQWDNLHKIFSFHTEAKEMWFYQLDVSYSNSELISKLHVPYSHWGLTVFQANNGRIKNHQLFRLQTNHFSHFRWKFAHPFFAYSDYQRQPFNW